ncbi:MAG: HD domain-containing protein [Armatimonadota bacterium]|jgi:guanosine-3',5'-bis(diphosphate) 3'-pyrophosphohydrolase
MISNGPDPLILVGLHVRATDAIVLRRAFAWSVAAHHGQVRKDGSRLIDHVVGVARNVQRFDEDGELDLLVAALLHDIVENTDVPLSDVEDRFGARVARLVDAVTNREGESAADSALRALEVGRAALLLRLCDRLDGIRRSRGRAAGKRRAFLEASRDTHLALAEEHFPALGEAMRGALAEAEASLD